MILTHRLTGHREISLLRNRRALHPQVLALLGASIACTMAAELAFTAWRTMYDAVHMGGHILKLAAYYLMYRALLVTGLRAPFDLIFRELKQTEAALRHSQESLEDQIRDRTASLEAANRTLAAEAAERKLAVEVLRASEERFRLVFEHSPVALFEEDFSGVRAWLDELRALGVVDLAGHLAQHPEAIRDCVARIRILDVNRAALALHGASRKEELLAGLAGTFTPASYETVREELLALWQGATAMARDAGVRTLAGTSVDVTVYLAVCPGHERSLSRVLVSLVDVNRTQEGGGGDPRAQPGASTSRCRAAKRPEPVPRRARGRSVHHRDRVDLHLRAEREGRDLDGGPGGLHAGEVPAVHLVHLRELAEVGEEHAHPHHLLEARAGRGEHRLQVLHHPDRLVLDRPGHQLAGGGVDRGLAGEVEGARALGGDRLAVGADRLRRGLGRDRGLHVGIIAHHGSKYSYSLPA